MSFNLPPNSLTRGGISTVSGSQATALTLAAASRAPLRESGSVVEGAADVGFAERVGGRTERSSASADKARVKQGLRAWAPLDTDAALSYGCGRTSHPNGVVGQTGDVLRADGSRGRASSSVSQYQVGMASTSTGRSGAANSTEKLQRQGCSLNIENQIDFLTLRHRTAAGLWVRLCWRISTQRSSATDWRHGKGR